MKNVVVWSLTTTTTTRRGVSDGTRGHQFVLTFPKLRLFELQSSLMAHCLVTEILGRKRSEH